MEPNTRTISVRDIPVTLWKKVRLKAIATGESVSSFVQNALESALSGHKDGKK